MQTPARDPLEPKSPVWFTWAVIRPSALRTVAYMNSEFVTAAAGEIECRQYLALVLERPLSKLLNTWIAFLVEPCNPGNLPRTYLPIWPCTLGDREPLRPGFDWPFGDCIVNTQRASIVPCSVESNNSPHILPSSEANRFRSLFVRDGDTLGCARALDNKIRKRQERMAEGFSSGTYSDWTNFSKKSTDLHVQPGEVFRPVTDLSAEIHYDLSVVHDLGTLEELNQDRDRILRVLTRFSHPSAERTIRWTSSIQSLLSSTEKHGNSDSPSPLQQPSPDPVSLNVAYDDDFASPDSDEESDGAGESGYSWPDDEFPGVAEISMSPPVLLVGLPQIIYFDIYGTLIDKETGIFTALSSIFQRSPYQFARPEALSFYYESESEMKKCEPDVPYAQILADAYDDVVLRLGISPEGTDSSTFAQSIKDWPAIPAAEWCLATLRTLPSISLVAIADVDRDSLERTTSFAPLAPYFHDVFTWDACKAYKPARAAVGTLIKHSDVLGVPRGDTCFVSNSLLNMEPARELGVPTVWARYAGSLAGNVCYMEEESPEVAMVHAGLVELASSFLLMANPTLGADVWAELDFDLLDEDGWVALDK
ncbi:HAD-like domain-containing protein [Mycena crocata]|nr:HAD-like domain-containing protein [Mycena crocata]